MAGQAAQSGSDFQDRGMFGNAGGIGDACEHGVIGEKILPQTLMGPQVIFCQKLLRCRCLDHFNTHTMSAGTGVRK